MVLAASVFFVHGMNNIADISEAHKMLSSLLGNKLAPILFAVALIASGQSSTITGTLAGQIIMEGYLNIKMKPWKRRLLTRSLAIIPASITLIFFGENKLTELMIISQVLLSLQLGFAIIPLIHFVSDKKIMGKFAITFWVKILAWASAIVVVSLNMKLVASTYDAWFSIGDIWWMGVLKYLTLGFLILALWILLYITFYPLIHSHNDDEYF